MSKVLSVDLTDTLMAYDNNFETHLPSGERHSTYYFRVPPEWASLPQAELDVQTLGVMQKIYYAFNEHFRQVEPNDISYLAPLAVSCHVLTAGEERAKPWLTSGSPAVWEWTPCVVVTDAQTYTKVDPSEF
ncbi:MAG: hypothetical protein ABJA50_08405 [Chloroflexota bacterium]